MFSSLRVRLPLLFLAGIALAGIVSALISIQLLRSFARDQTNSELSREATGIAQLYQSAVDADFASPKGDPAVRRPSPVSSSSTRRAT